MLYFSLCNKHCQWEQVSHHTLLLVKGVWENYPYPFFLPHLPFVVVLFCLCVVDKTAFCCGLLNTSITKYVSWTLLCLLHEDNCVSSGVWGCCIWSLTLRLTYPSLISLMVSVDVKHHVYLLTYWRTVAIIAYQPDWQWHDIISHMCQIQTRKRF